jgi:hypothetical protein
VAARSHKGAGSGDGGQQAGRHRGVETGNGWTASTGRGKPKGVVFRQAHNRAGILRTIADVITRKGK